MNENVIKKQRILIDDREYDFLATVGPIEEKFMRLEYDNIGEIVLSNDIEQGIPKLQIQYTDINFQSVSKIEANGLTVVTFEISCPQVEIERGRQIKAIFTIDDIQLISTESNQANYIITATHSDISVLSDYVDMAAYGENPIDIILKIFKKSGLKMVNEQPLPKVNCNHISGSSNTVISQCAYLCDIASSTNLGSYFVVYNLFLNKWTIVSTGDAKKITYQTEDTEEFLIPTEKDSDDKASVISNFKQIKVRDKSKSGIPSYTVKRYNSIKRVWETKPITHKSFKFNINPLMKDMKPSLANEIDIRKKTIYLPNDRNIGNVARNLILYTDVIEFEVMGNLRKEVGSYIVLNSSSVELNKKFGGVWMIAKIDHVINKTGYRCNIVAVRATNLKYENSKKAGDA